MYYIVVIKNDNAGSWLLLILTLPGRQPALRMRVWRRLQAAGAGVLRDGVHVLPNRPELAALLQGLCRDVVEGSGTARVIATQDGNGFPGLFDRAADYEKLLRNISATARSLSRAGSVRALDKVERLRRDLEAIAAVDYFPGEALQRTRRAFDALHAQSLARFADEPHSSPGKISRLKRAEFQHRTWQTRARPWVDRLASAWLIRRFIDPAARFLWVAKPTNAAGNALGFDYDGAAFTHVGDKVTFEVLLESFGLQRNRPLCAIAQLVHYLDVGGPPVAEAAGVETMLRGMRDRIADDPQLFIAAAQMFDDLHRAFETRSR